MFIHLVEKNPNHDWSIEIVTPDVFQSTGVVELVLVLVYWHVINGYSYLKMWEKAKVRRFGEVREINRIQHVARLSTSVGILVWNKTQNHINILDMLKKPPNHETQMPHRFASSWFHTWENKPSSSANPSFLNVSRNIWGLGTKHVTQRAVFAIECQCRLKYIYI